MNTAYDTASRYGTIMESIDMDLLVNRTCDDSFNSAVMVNLHLPFDAVL